MSDIQRFLCRYKWWIPIIALCIHFILLQLEDWISGLFIHREHDIAMAFWGILIPGYIFMIAGAYLYVKVYSLIRNVNRKKKLMLGSILSFLLLIRLSFHDVNSDPQFPFWSYYFKLNFSMVGTYLFPLVILLFLSDPPQARGPKISLPDLFLNKKKYLPLFALIFHFILLYLLNDIITIKDKSLVDLDSWSLLFMLPAYIILISGSYLYMSIDYLFKNSNPLYKLVFGSLITLGIILLKPMAHNPLNSPHNISAFQNLLPELVFIGTYLFPFLFLLYCLNRKNSKASLQNN